MGNRRTVADASDFEEVPKTQFVTVICDASWSDRTLCGGWAGRVTYAGQRFTFSGPIRSRLTASLEAEIAAVANTLVAASKAARLPSGKGWGWLLQSDNLHTVQTLNHHFQDRSNRSWPKHPPVQPPLVRRAVAVISDLAAVYTPKFILARHVKGHMRKDDRDPRHHVQELMDKLARAERLQLENSA